MKKPASLAEAAAIAQFRLAIIAPVIHELYPDASRAASIDKVSYDIPMQFISMKVVNTNDLPELLWPVLQPLR